MFYYCQKGDLSSVKNVENTQNIVVIELVYTQHVPKRNGTSYQHAGQVGNIRQGAEQGRAAAAALFPTGGKARKKQPAACSGWEQKAASCFSFTEIDFSAFKSVG